MKREVVIAGLASEGLALILGSAEAGSSAVVGPMPTDPVKFRKCARDLKALSAAKEQTNEERGGGRDPGVRRPGAGRGQLPARSNIFRAAMHEFFVCFDLFFPIRANWRPSKCRLECRQRLMTKTSVRKTRQMEGWPVRLSRPWL